MDEKFGKYTGIEQKSKNKVEEYINGLREIEKEERIRLYINSVSKNMPIQMFVYLFDIFKQSTNGAIYKPIPYLGDIRLFIAEDTEKIVFHRSERSYKFLERKLHWWCYCYYDSWKSSYMFYWCKQYSEVSKYDYEK